MDTCSCFLPRARTRPRGTPGRRAAAAGSCREWRIAGHSLPFFRHYQSGLPEDGDIRPSQLPLETLQEIRQPLPSTSVPRSAPCRPDCHRVVVLGKQELEVYRVPLHRQDSVEVVWPVGLDPGTPAHQGVPCPGDCLGPGLFKLPGILEELEGACARQLCRSGQPAADRL